MQIYMETHKKNLTEFHLRDCNLSGSVVVETEGATLQHLEAKPLTLVSVYVH